MDGVRTLDQDIRTVLKKSNGFISHKSYGEAADADSSVTSAAVPYPRTPVAQYGSDNAFNTDEFAFYYCRHSPKTTICPARLPCRNGAKST